MRTTLAIAAILAFAGCATGVATEYRFSPYAGGQAELILPSGPSWPVSKTLKARDLAASRHSTSLKIRGRLVSFVRLWQHYQRSAKTASDYLRRRALQAPCCRRPVAVTEELVLSR